MEDKNFDFKEEADYQQGGYDEKELVGRHMRKISDITVKELTPSYWNKKPIKTQSGVMFTEEYHEDLREAYCNAVDFLVDVLLPNGDQKFKDYILDNDNDFECELDSCQDERSKNKIIKNKLKLKRKIFREINMMFFRTNFWNKSDSSDE